MYKFTCVNTILAHHSEQTDLVSAYTLCNKNLMGHVPDHHSKNCVCCAIFYNYVLKFRYVCICEMMTMQ